MNLPAPPSKIPPLACLFIRQPLPAQFAGKDNQEFHLRTNRHASSPITPAS